VLLLNTSLESFSPPTNLVEKITNFRSNTFQNKKKKMFYENHAPQARVFMKTNAPQARFF